MNLIEWIEHPAETDDLTGAPIRRFGGRVGGLEFFSLAAPTRHNSKWRAFRIALGDDRQIFDRETEAEAKAAAEGWIQGWLVRAGLVRAV